jgi:hypothetical protein
MGQSPVEGVLPNVLRIHSFRINSELEEVNCSWKKEEKLYNYYKIGLVSQHFCQSFVLSVVSLR